MKNTMRYRLQWGTSRPPLRHLASKAPNPTRRSDTGEWNSQVLNIVNLSAWTPFCWIPMLTLQWRHNGLNSVLNHQPHHCLLNRYSRRRSKKTSKLRVTGLCAGNSPVSNAENVSIWWRLHDNLNPSCTAVTCTQDYSGLHNNTMIWTHFRQCRLFVGEIHRFTNGFPT